MDDYQVKDVLGLFDEYVKGVSTGKILACKYVKQAVKRHRDDLKNGRKRGLHFDRDEARRVMEIICFFRHTKGSFQGRFFDLQPYQAFIVGSLFGWLRSDGTRRFREAYIEMARKSAKSELAAAIALYMLIFDGEKGAEVYSVATKAEQAHFIFDAAQYMAIRLIEDSEYIAEQVKVNSHRIVVQSNKSFFKILAKDRGKGDQDGGSPHCYCIDEYHAHPDDSARNTGKTGMGERSQPLTLITTTAGTNIGSVCYSYRTICTHVLNGTIENDSLFSMIYTLDEGDDYTNPKVWGKPNPHLGVTPRYEYLEEQVLSARTEGGSTEVNVKTKNFNIWTTTHSTWIPDEKWMTQKLIIPDVELEQSECVGGLDLAQVYDLAALTLTFHIEETGLPYQKHFYWCPEGTIMQRARESRVDYKKWVDQGLITATPGESINHEVIVEDVLKLAEKYRIVNIGYDRALGDWLVSKLIDSELDMIKYPQTITDLSPPTKEMARRIMDGKLKHEGNRVQRWQMGNVLIYTNSNADIKIDKGKSVDKVDGPVSAVMSLGQYMTWRIEKSSVYEERGVISLKDL